MRSLRLGAEARVTDQRWQDGWPSADALAIAPLGTEDCGPDVTPKVSPDTVNRELVEALERAVGEVRRLEQELGGNADPLSAWRRARVRDAIREANEPESKLTAQRQRYQARLRERDTRIALLEQQVVGARRRLQARIDELEQVTQQHQDPPSALVDAQVRELRHLAWALLVGALRVASGEADRAERDTLVAMWRWMHEQQRSLAAGPFGPDSAP